MGKGAKVNFKRNFKKRVRSKDKGSDDSDEDYVIEDEENESHDDSEDFGDSLDGYASEESYGSFIEEEKEEEEFRKAVRSKKKKGSSENGKIGSKTLQKRKRVSYEEEEDEDYVDDEDYDDDEEFTLDEDDDCLDEDVELTAKKKNNCAKVRKRNMRKRVSRRGQKRRKSRVSKKPTVKKGRSNQRLRKKEKGEYDDEDFGDFMDNSPVMREKGKKSLGGRRKCRVHSDSEFLSSESSGDEYTISEEEREQVREASKLCGDLKTSLRSSYSMKRGISENEDLCQQEKPPVRKGKEKMKEVKSEAGKQVCGICLSEEDKRRLKGALNCCSHYFCFTCIMEWSKVESRCPLCKRRFKTITKDGRATVDLRNVVIQVPKRDQVYQPSEEEIRSFIDPYENVICTECHEGGDDGLMLLCDLCDSPAHTYCVGLGRQVPEGNWYCNGCRPVALGSSSSRGQEPLLDRRTVNNAMVNRPSLNLNLKEDSNLTLEASPRVASTQGFGYLSSPRLPPRDVLAASPVSGAGAPTLSGRRQIQRHIQYLISANRMNHVARMAEGISAANLCSNVSNSQIDQGRETFVANSRTQDTVASQNTFFEERVQDNNLPSSSVQNWGFFPLGPSQLRRQAVQDPNITTTDRSVNLTLWPELTGINSVVGHEQSNQCSSRSGIGTEGNLAPYSGREESQVYVIKEQLQLMVERHLERLSQDTVLGHDSFNDITRSSTNTILAALGLEQKRCEVENVPSPSVCTHVDRMDNGQTSLIKGFCASCFESFVRDVVKGIMDNTVNTLWLSLGLRV